MRLDDRTFVDLLDARVHDPDRIIEAHAFRTRRTTPTRDGMLFIVAADHTARGMVGLGGDPLAMADRRTMLSRLLTALDHPRVDGVLASADIMDDLVLLGALDDKVAVGTMNRGGLAGAAWELDDRFTAYDTGHLGGEPIGEPIGEPTNQAQRRVAAQPQGSGAKTAIYPLESLVSTRIDAGKMLLRIDDDDPGTVPTLHACSRAVQELNDRRMIAMVEPIPYTRDQSGRAVPDDRPNKLVRAVGVCAALGGASSRTWLKVQATADIAAVAGMTTQPLLLLGGAPGPDPSATFAAWELGLDQPTVRGLVVGRALLYPPDGDVAAAVGRAAELVARAATAKGIR